MNSYNQLSFFSKIVFNMSRLRKEKKTPGRFHGAFRGGFSAGHFNTVGSTEGWAPSNYKSGKKQQIQDFMDEEDEETWGGVVSVHNDYQDRSSLLSNAIQNQQQKNDTNNGKGEHSSLMLLPVEYLESSFNIQDRIGMKLLKQLGWNFKNSNKDSIKLPPPKHDQYGLDFDPYKNAPEFKKARDQIRMRAKNRATDALGGGIDSYHTSHLLDENEEDQRNGNFQMNRIKQDSSSTNVNETIVEDFIGDKTVSGFALKDDADDVYDINLNDPSGAIQSSQYQTHIYEASDSDDDVQTNTFPTSKDSNIDGSFDQALRNWATNSKEDQHSGTLNGKGLTTDGRPPLPGFRLGVDSIEQVIRWPGPDLPRDYQVRKHEFKEENEETNEFLQKYPLDYGTSRHHVTKKINVVKEKSNSQLIPPVTNYLNNPQPSIAMAGPAFSQLAMSMKNRFTSSSTKNESIHLPSGKSGLAKPKPNTMINTNLKDREFNSIKDRSKEIRRVVTPWIPSSLLCKRLQVPVIKKSTPSTVTVNTSSFPGGKSEQSYFDSTIQPLLKNSKDNGKKKNKNNSDKTLISTSSTTQEENDNLVSIPERPSLDLFKAIFQSDSDSDNTVSSDEKVVTSTQKEIPNTGRSEMYKNEVSDKDNVNKVTIVEKAERAEKPTHKFISKNDRERDKTKTLSKTLDSQKIDDSCYSDNTILSQNKERKQRKYDKKRRSKSSRRKRDRKSHRRRGDSDSSSYSSDEERRRKRRRKHKRTKHNKSDGKRRHHRSSSSHK